MEYPMLTKLIASLESSSEADDKALLMEIAELIDLAEEAAAVKNRAGAPRFTKAERDAVFDALKKICRLPDAIAASYVAKTVTELLKMGKQATDVYQFANWWYSEDFRGKKNQPPTMNQVVTMIEQAKGYRQLPQDGSRFLAGEYASEIGRRA